MNMLCEVPYYVKLVLPLLWFSLHFLLFSSFFLILLHIILCDDNLYFNGLGERGG